MKCCLLVPSKTTVVLPAYQNTNI